MMQKNTGKPYELFVQMVQQAILNNETLSHIETIKVETNKKIKDFHGIEREFDLYWEFNLGGVLYKTVIECKDYASTISIEKIDALIGKIDSIPGLRAIYATKTGYQKGAAQKAKEYNIDLLIVREATENDWFDEDGTPLIRKIFLCITAISNPIITTFNPTISKKWLEESGYTLADIHNVRQAYPYNNQIYIHDLENDQKYSVLDLQSLLPKKIKNMQYGKGEFKEEFLNANLEFPHSEIKIKILGYHLTYSYDKPRTGKYCIDFSDQLLAIVEKYGEGKKRMVFNSSGRKLGLS